MDSATQKIPADPDPQPWCLLHREDAEQFKKPNKVHSPVEIITFGEIAVTTNKNYKKTESVCGYRLSTLYFVLTHFLR
jgi:hypothetical protein